MAEPERCEPVRAVASGASSCVTTVNAVSRNALSHNVSVANRDCLRRGNSVELIVAAGATNTLRPLTPEPSRREGLFMDATHDLSPDDARPHIVDMLDAARKQEQACAINKARYMLLARRHGISVAEIAELLDMSQPGVRKAVKRIAQSMPEWAL